LNNFILFLRSSRGGLIFLIILRFKPALMLKKSLTLCPMLNNRHLFNNRHIPPICSLSYTMFIILHYTVICSLSYNVYIIIDHTFLEYPFYHQWMCALSMRYPVSCYPTPLPLNLPILRPYVLPIL